MKKINFILWLMIPALVLVLASCGGEKKATEQAPAAEEQTTAAVEQTEFDMLAAHLESTSNMLGKTKKEGGAPFMIKADKVYENMAGNIHIIDLRGAKDFAEGAIEGAVPVESSDLLRYIENDIDAASYDKIVLVCYTGQTAGFATAVLRAMGHENVYDMKWGMCAWNKKFADRRLNKPADAYADMVETTENPMPEAGGYPELATGMETAEEILAARAQEVLGMGFSSARIKAEELFEDPSQFYLVNYWPKERYDVGHIVGSVQYEQSKSLLTSAQLNTLPNDGTPIVVYCYTGQHSAHVAAYLRLLGYEAYSLLYGANSFMKSKIAENDWTHFKTEYIHDYPTVESEYVAPAGGEEDGGGC